jgi:hypothetical protein
MFLDLLSSARHPAIRYEYRLVREKGSECRGITVSHALGEGDFGIADLLPKLRIGLRVGRRTNNGVQQQRGNDAQI